MPDICDYEGSDYQTRFWKNADRHYEDASERVALKRLLPPAGGRIAEFGAGFGRLADLYAGYREVVLVDYSRTLLEEAMQRWGSDPRFTFVAADIYHLPFAPGALDAATMVRVLHHLADPPAALAQIRAAMAPGGVFVLEYANKRNLKAIARYALGRQTWSPYTPEPVEFVKLNFDFHPRYVERALRAAGFGPGRSLAVSYLRAGPLKRVLPVQAMVAVDAALQLSAPLGALSPSVFVRNTVPGAAVADADRARFVSPRSGAPLRRDGDVMICDADGTRWRVSGNFYDFKEPLAS
ncbi:MAG: class I SAM-dependent methyltransferase [Thermoflexales bacterium]|nr:class I SAM-dependent methyltransferase [Thermoflexales bacterium]